MQTTELTPRTKEILIKLFDLLEISSHRQSGHMGRFLYKQGISPEEAREVAQTGKALILS